jgi:transposase
MIQSGARRSMGKFRQYAPEQVWLLPPSVEDVLGSDHLSFFVHQVIERLDRKVIENSYSREGQPGYHPRMLLKLWLYAYCLGVTSSRRLEQRTREDLGFRYLAGGEVPDHWVLNEFRRRHRKAMNDVFTQVVEMARDLGMARLGHVAIDSTRVAANASRDRIVTEEKLRQERNKTRRMIRQWQTQCQMESAQEQGGTQVEAGILERLAEVERQWKKLKKSGLNRQSATDPDSRFLKKRGGFVLGYTAEVAVSEDHFVVGQRVTQEGHDHGSLAAMVEQVEQRCEQVPERVTADSGYYNLEQIAAVADRSIDVYVPDSNLARELNGGPEAEAQDPRMKKFNPAVLAMREKMRSEAGRRMYRKRKSTVEAVFGTIKEQRNGRRFRLRGLTLVGAEFTLMTLAYNVTRMYNVLAGAS